MPLPDQGRIFTAHRTVRLADASRLGRLRLDALARFLQDVGVDDARDAGFGFGDTWLARRAAVEVEAWPRLGDRLEFRTFCGGTGGRWAERRTSVRSERGAGHIEIAALWVFVDGASGRPSSLPAQFIDLYGEATGGRTVSSRLSHPSRPPGGADGRSWAVRAVDLDVLDHVTNAAYWQVVEDELWRRGVDGVGDVGRFEVEFRVAIDPTDDIRIEWDDMGHLWLVAADDIVRATARLALHPRQ